MPRYLTPARICLLVLVRLYLSGRASTPSSLLLLDFIARRTTAALQHNLHALDDQKALCSSDIPGFGHKLQQWTSKFPGRSIYDVLLQGIWDLNGLDSLNTLITQLRQLTEPALEDEEEEEADLAECLRITPSSPVGQFVRRCYVEFTRLQFAESQTLWNSFAAYRSSTRDQWLRLNPGVATSGLFSPDDHTPLSDSVSTTSTSNASAVDTDMLLGFAINQLQKVGARVPEDIKSRLEEWIDEQLDSGTQSLRFFMAFFEYWRAGQYTMALESLHRYFDYSLAARSGADNMKVFYQYALLHLSVLHADFECWDDSVDAMNECIATGKREPAFCHTNHVSTTLPSC
jgi:anaphase-promoting complex subunit 5